MSTAEKDAAFWAWFGDDPMPNGGQIAARLTSEIERKAAEPASSPGTEPEAPWVERVQQLVGQGETDEALDVLYREVDVLLRAGAIDDCDRALGSFQMNRLDVPLLVGLLAASLPARDVLPRRPELVNRVAARLSIVAPDRVERLIGGLRLQAARMDCGIHRRPRRRLNVPTSPTAPATAPFLPPHPPRRAG